MTARIRWRHAAGRVILVGMGMLIALVMAEAGARVLPFPEGHATGTSWQCDRQLGWRGRPDYSKSIRMEQEPSHEVKFNSLGMHDDEHERAKDASVFRILLLGDSFVEAREVDRALGSHQVLEDALNAAAAPGMRYEVIVGACAAWGPAQELQYFRSEGQVFAPDLVVALWYPANDLGDVLPYNRLTCGNVTCYAPYFNICDGELDPDSWYPVPGIPPVFGRCPRLPKVLASAANYVYFHSRLYQRIEPILRSPSQEIGYGSYYTVWREQASATNEVLQYSYRLTVALYSRLAVEARQIGAKTALVMVPVKDAVYSDADPAYFEELQARLGRVQDVNLRLPNHLFGDLMAAEQLPVLDLHATFVDYTRRHGKVLYWTEDSHWNVAGNHLAGVTIAQWLADQHLVPALAHAPMEGKVQ